MKRLHAPIRTTLCCLSLGALAIGLPASATAEDGRGRVDADNIHAALVRLLDDDDFQTRRRAAELLIEAAMGGEYEAVLAALESGLKHPSLEIRLSSAQTIHRINDARLQKQLRRLLNPRIEPQGIELIGWSNYSSAAGDDMPARRLFAALVTRYPAQLRQLQNNPRADLPKQFDPYQLAPDNLEAWVLLLISETLEDRGTRDWSRTGMALTIATLGPSDTSHPYSRVVQRLIDRWLASHLESLPVRESLLIAMRYGCENRANALCDQILRNRDAPAAAQVMALLTALRLGRSDLETHARSLLDDDRTAHVWQLIASRQTKIRTQVRDVALVVLLHQRGLDPRDVGFVELQADPVFIYRDHSLGFADNAARAEAHALGRKRLAMPAR